MASVTVSVPDEEFQFLVRKAMRSNTSVEGFLLHHVERIVLEGKEEEARMARDPIYQLPPAYKSDLDDLADQHDHYLYGVPRK